jgi:hypothetical protein
MSKDALANSVRDDAKGSVRIRIDACGGVLTIAVIIDNSTLKLPKEHAGMLRADNWKVLTVHSADPEGHFWVSEKIGEHIEFTVHSTKGDNHNNPLTSQLLSCFTDADYQQIDAILAKLAEGRGAWWQENLVEYAAKLGKSVNELTPEDTRPLHSPNGFRNYPLFDRTSEHDNYPTIQVNRQYLDTRLRMLMTRLLDEAAVAV